ncbi:MAG: hypothetical protein ACMX3H_02375 [Sodalis sp. (in: enterobacteria)]|uniref:hypothetical protein n=1 Tax=Sodalis sp. (in: enterobacteria) TaxID=1898979 RepID=UPI0039E32554
MKPDDGLPAPFADFDPALRVVDIIMHPPETPLIARAPGGLSGDQRPADDRRTADGVLAIF